MKKKIISSLIFILVGGIAGYAYWYFIGCSKGTCPITSKWLNTTLYGGLLGYLLGSSVLDMIEKKKQVKNNDIATGD